LRESFLLRSTGIKPVSAGEGVKRNEPHKQTARAQRSD